MTDTVTTVEQVVDVLADEAIQTVVDTPEVTAVVTVDEAVHVVEVTEPQVIIEEIDRVSVVTECRQGPVGSQGPQGPQGPPGLGAAVPVRSVAAAGATVNIDTLNVSLVRARKWILTVTDLAAGRTRMSEVMAFHDSTGAKHVQYGLIGAAFDVEITSIVTAGQLVLGLVNNESVELQIDAVQVGSISI